MGQVQTLASDLAGFLGTTLVHGTVLAVVTAAIVMLFRRARPALLSALWSVVLLKFLLPVAPASPFSLSGVFQPAAASLADSASSQGTAAASTGALVSAHGRELEPWSVIVMLLVSSWIVGIAFVAWRRIRAWRALRRQVLTLVSPGPSTLDSVSRAAQRIGLRRAPRVRVCPRASSAYLFGWFSPILVVPTWPSPEELDVILLHEIAHLRRRDSLVHLLQAIATTLFFFWPPLLWVSRQIDLLREKACDDWAIVQSGMRPGRYARVLIAVAERARAQGQVPAMAFAPRAGHLEHRVMHLMTSRKRPAISGAMGLVTLCWSAVALAGAQDDDGPRQEVLCATDPRIGKQILASYPEADRDGDGNLSKDEICAHQLRMQRRLVDVVVDGLPDDQLRRGDRDGDGTLSSGELSALKERLVVAVQEDAEDQQSRLVLQLGPGAGAVSNLEAFATVEEGALTLSTAEVSGAVCEPTAGRCVETTGATASGADGIVLINVAPKGVDPLDSTLKRKRD